MCMNWRNMAYWAILITAATQVEGCADHRPAPIPQVTPRVICLPQPTYSRDFLEKAGVELAVYSPKIPALTRLVGDYENMRDRNAVCRSHQ